MSNAHVFGSLLIKSEAGWSKPTLANDCENSMKVNVRRQRPPPFLPCYTIAQRGARVKFILSIPRLLNRYIHALEDKSEMRPSRRSRPSAKESSPTVYTEHSVHRVFSVPSFLFLQNICGKANCINLSLQYNVQYFE